MHRLTTTVSYGELPFFWIQQDFVRVAGPFRHGRYVFRAISDTGAINTVAGFSTLCKCVETVRKP